MQKILFLSSPPRCALSALAALLLVVPGVLWGQQTAGNDADAELAALVLIASPEPMPESSSNTTGGAEEASRKIFKDGEDCNVNGTLSIEGDENETWFVITLAAPIRVALAGGGDPVFVQTFQIAGLDQSGWEKARKLAGKSVHVNGRLMEAHTRHHHTSVLIIASQLQPR